jgi:hypothetical protein
MGQAVSHRPRPPRLRSVPVGFAVDWDRFFYEYVCFPLSISLHRCSNKRKNEKTNHLHHRVAIISLKAAVGP